MKNAMKDDGIKMNPVLLAKKTSQNPPELNKTKSGPNKHRILPNISEMAEEKILKEIDEFSRNNLSVKDAGILKIIDEH